MQVGLQKEFGVMLDRAELCLMPEGAKSFKGKAVGALHQERKMKTVDDIELEASSRTVFADLGLVGADDLAYKAGLMGSILRYQ
jgi:hypothetical protein